jgi:predicted nucleic acid-binding protein
MGMKEAYHEKRETQLKEWSAKIDQLLAKVERLPADVRLQYYRQTDTLREKQAAARHKLEELKTAGESAWEEVKEGMERAWEELREVFKKVWEKVQ